MHYTQSMKSNGTKRESAGQAFWRGMGSFDLFPPPPPVPETTTNTLASAWEGVGNAFAETGDCMRRAMKELCNAEGLVYPDSWK
jgi:uncharacterized protein YukE